MPDTLPPTAESLEPVFIAADRCIRYGGEDYGRQWSAAAFIGGRAPALNIAAGEVPRRILDGFVYGESVFLRSDPYDDEDVATDAHIERMLRLDAMQRRTAVDTRSIPAEYEDEIVRLSATLRPRGIVAWLLKEKGFETSYGAVDRVIRRRKREARLAALDEELRRDFQTARVDYRETAELMIELQHELVERMSDKSARDELVPTLRTCHHTVSLLERELRDARRYLVRGSAHHRPRRPRALRHPPAQRRPARPPHRPRRPLRNRPVCSRWRLLTLLLRRPSRSQRGPTMAAATNGRSSSAVVTERGADGDPWGEEEDSSRPSWSSPAVCSPAPSEGQSPRCTACTPPGEPFQRTRASWIRGARSTQADPASAADCSRPAPAGIVTAMRRRTTLPAWRPVAPSPPRQQKTGRVARRRALPRLAATGGRTVKFYVQHDGSELMFPSFKDFQTMYRLKFVGPEDMVRRESSERWVRVGDMPELRGTQSREKMRRQTGAVTLLMWLLVGLFALVMLGKFFFGMKPIAIPSDLPGASDRH